MKCNAMNLSLSFVPPIHEADRSGMTYTEEAICDACANASGVPITAYNKYGDEVVIGSAQSVRYEGGRVCMDGVVFYGGTQEYSNQTYDLNLVTKCKLASFTLCS